MALSAVPGTAVAPTITTALAMPRLVRLGPNLYGAAFSLMKLIPARHILDRAAADGRLAPGATVIETTSGTFGLALAMECALRGHPLILVSDPAVDPRLRRRLGDLGAVVEIVGRPAPEGGWQQARLDRLGEVASRRPRHFLPDQYANPDHPSSYAAFAGLLGETLGPVDCLVGPVGSGGSMCGTAAALRSAAPLRVVGVDTPGSVLFGLPDGPRQLRGLGNSLLPANLDHRAFDEVHWVHDHEAFAATRLLHRRHALFMGPTSGAAWLVADWRARVAPDERVVVLLPDEGHRYLDTVYDDGWLADRALRRGAPPTRPLEVDRPGVAGPRWSRLRWGRRTLADLVPTGARTGTAA